MIEKVTLGEALNAAQLGSVTSLIGLSSEDVAKADKQSAKNFIGVYNYEYELQPGQEVELGQLGYAIFLICDTSSGTAGLYVFGSYQSGLVFSSDSPSLSSKHFGDYNTGSDRNIVFGRKSSNSTYTIKNNKDYTSTIQIRRLYFG